MRHANGFHSQSKEFVENFKGDPTLANIIFSYAEQMGLKNCKIERTQHQTKGLFYNGPDYICELNDVINKEEITDEFNRCREWINNYINRMEQTQTQIKSTIKFNIFERFIMWLFRGIFNKKIKETKELKFGDVPNPKLGDINNNLKCTMQGMVENLNSEVLKSAKRHEELCKKHNTSDIKEAINKEAEEIFNKS